MKKKNILIMTLLFLMSCAGLEEAGKVLRNEKTKTTDEFLVKKKDPLVMPPDYNKMPEPDSLKENKVDEKDKIRKIMKKDKLKADSMQKGTTNKIEQSIIDKIRK
mgnify:CR=1 FL=1|tara:strand:- start:2258 stop:2572 length:315 start_codon:yes stop_codon:yes gene_type:complete